MMNKTIVLFGIAILMLVTGQSVTGLSLAEEDAYSRGYSDAVADAHYEHGHGYDSSCPGGHSATYCQNYQQGYAAGWQSTRGEGQGQGEAQGQEEKQGYWILTVNLREVPVNLLSIYVQAVGPSGHTVGANSLGGVARLQLPQSEFPSGQSYTIGVWKPEGLGSWQQFLFMSTGQNQMYTYHYMAGHMYPLPSYVERS
jgi:hypothetical protein